MTIKKLDLDRDGKVSFSDFETTVKVTLLDIKEYGRDKHKGSRNCTSYIYPCPLPPTKHHVLTPIPSEANTAFFPDSLLPLVLSGPIHHPSPFRLSKNQHRGTKIKKFRVFLGGRQPYTVKKVIDFLGWGRENR
jgi:hypothetical protein